MGLLPSIGAPTPAPGKYVDPGSPTKILKFAAVQTDQARGTFIDFPIMVVCLGILYKMAVLDGEENQSIGGGDVLFILIVAFVLKRMGIASRWKGVL